MKYHAMEAVGAGGKTVKVKQGDPWPAPYRGSQYTVKGGRGLTLVGWKRDPLGVQADPYPQQLATAVRATKGEHGSFRVTPHGAVITKVRVGGGTKWESRYVGLYENDLTFPGIDNALQSLEVGMYWPGLPFSHGEFWRVSPYAQGRNRLQWQSWGRTHSSTEEYPELIESCLDVRPRGGRIYITETGCVWMNVPDLELAPKHREAFRDKQEAQLITLKENGFRAALRLLRERIESTGARPLYVCRIGDFDHGDPPWTLFSPEAQLAGEVEEEEE